ncbi:expressed unknown protein [Seminavis robusta]|uniref:Uncharacterized protein n=1 Tax=Seminavis robusta TaxID=568900 RepID=A0A9N8EWK6_9STRA|nr:expressed unknown protein [Seminavis robusta]|eukprot:Sro2042_g312300.1 n/a (269) ;mRNA; f:10515-11321
MPVPSYVVFPCADDAFWCDDDDDSSICIFAEYDLCRWCEHAPRRGPAREQQEKPHSDMSLPAPPKRRLSLQAPVVFDGDEQRRQSATSLPALPRRQASAVLVLDDEEDDDETESSCSRLDQMSREDLPTAPRRRSTLTLDDEGLAELQSLFTQEHEDEEDDGYVHWPCHVRHSHHDLLLDDDRAIDFGSVSSTEGRCDGHDTCMMPPRLPQRQNSHVGLDSIAASPCQRQRRQERQSPPTRRRFRPTTTAESLPCQPMVPFTFTSRSA